MRRSLYKAKRVLELALVDEQFKALEPVNHDDRDTFEVGEHPAIVGLDIALLEHERDAGTNSVDDRERLLAQVATGTTVDRDQTRHVGTPSRLRSPVAYTSNVKYSGNLLTGVYRAADAIIA